MTLPERLAHLPDRKRRELERAAQILFDELEESLKTKLSEKGRRGRILKLILFGSYARGDWVEDRKSGYSSRRFAPGHCYERPSGSLRRYWGARSPPGRRGSRRDLPDDLVQALFREEPRPQR